MFARCFNAANLPCLVHVRSNRAMPQGIAASLASVNEYMQAWTFLGLCQVSMGDIQLGASNYERVLRQDPENLEACVYLAQARKEV